MKLVLIDGHAILHRAFHALPPLTTKIGEPINAVYGLVSMLLRVIADLKPTHLAVCFDVKAPTFRHKEYKEYQSQRPEMARELSSQITKAKDVITAFGIPIFEKAGYEADDVIGTIAAQCTEIPNSKFQIPNKLQIKNYKLKIDEVVVVTGDRDLLQLVNDRVRLYMPLLGLSTAKLYGEAETKEKIGIAPELIPDYKALVGDPSDNYRGVPGIGPKTAINLLSKFKSLSKIYEHLDELPKNLKRKLIAGRKSAEMSHKLATIVRSVPLDLDLDSCSKWKVDSQKVLDLFSQYGFKTLTKRVKKVGRELDQQRQMSLL